MKKRLKSFIIETSLVAMGADWIINKIETTVNEWFDENPDVIIKQMTASQINDTRMILCLIYEEEE